MLGFRVIPTHSLRASELTIQHTGVSKKWDPFFGYQRESRTPATFRSHQRAENAPVRVPSSDGAVPPLPRGGGFLIISLPEKWGKGPFSFVRRGTRNPPTPNLPCFSIRGDCARIRLQSLVRTSACEFSGFSPGSDPGMAQRGLLGPPAASLHSSSSRQRSWS